MLHHFLVTVVSSAVFWLQKGSLLLGKAQMQALCSCFPTNPVICFDRSKW